MWKEGGEDGQRWGGMDVEGNWYWFEGYNG